MLQKTTQTTKKPSLKSPPCLKEGGPLAVGGFWEVRPRLRWEDSGRCDRLRWKDSGMGPRHEAIEVEMNKALFSVSEGGYYDSIR